MNTRTSTPLAALILLVLLSVHTTRAWAQDGANSSAQDDFDKLAKELDEEVSSLASAPQLPAAALLSLSPEQVSRPDTVTDVAAQVGNFFGEDGQLKTGLAIEIAPFRLGKEGELIVTEQGTSTKAKPYLVRLKDSLRISVASAEATSVMPGEQSTGPLFSVGARVFLLNQRDPRNNENVLEKLENVAAQQFRDPAKDECINSPLPGLLGDDTKVKEACMAFEAIGRLPDNNCAKEKLLSAQRTPEEMQEVYGFAVSNGASEEDLAKLAKNIADFKAIEIPRFRLFASLRAKMDEALTAKENKKKELDSANKALNTAKEDLAKQKEKLKDVEARLSDTPDNQELKAQAANLGVEINRLNETIEALSKEKGIIETLSKDLATRESELIAAEKMAREAYMNLRGTATEDCIKQRASDAKTYAELSKATRESLAEGHAVELALAASFVSAGALGNGFEESDFTAARGWVSWDLTKKNKSSFGAAIIADYDDTVSDRGPLNARTGVRWSKSGKGVLGGQFDLTAGALGIGSGPTELDARLGGIASIKLADKVQARAGLQGRIVNERETIDETPTNNTSLQGAFVFSLAYNGLAIPFLAKSTGE